MFDIGWSELLLIAVVAVVVIGPKDLPVALRSLGRTIRGIRRMASDFQSQFNEALREAELDDLRREVSELRDTARGIVRDADVSAIARDELEGIRQSIDAKETAVEAVEAQQAADDEPMLPLPEPVIPPEEPELPLGPVLEEQGPPAAALAATAELPPEPPAPSLPSEPEPLPPERAAAPLRREPAPEPALMTHAAAEPSRP
ncbi:MAG TPA: Sec-independent protein translocase protein TatB [Hyphomicrobiales bacterium]|nr:Sec-independent protein translocase protein TatB [Hyphomicrobiales bacterium]